MNFKFITRITYILIELIGLKKIKINIQFIHNLSQYLNQFNFTHFKIDLDHCYIYDINLQSL